SKDTTKQTTQRSMDGKDSMEVDYEVVPEGGEAQQNSNVEKESPASPPPSSPTTEGSRSASKSRHALLEQRKREAEERKQREAEESKEKDLERRAKLAAQRSERRLRDIANKQVREEQRRREEQARDDEEVRRLTASVDALGGRAAATSNAVGILLENSVDKGTDGRYVMPRVVHDRFVRRRAQLLDMVARRTAQLHAARQAHDELLSHPAAQRRAPPRAEASTEGGAAAAAAAFPTARGSGAAGELPGPSPPHTLGVDAALAGQALRVRDFCYAFREPLQLAPFGIDDLNGALRWEAGPTVLLAEVHCALLTLLLREPTRGRALWADAVAADAGSLGKDMIAVAAAAAAEAAAAVARGGGGEGGEENGEGRRLDGSTAAAAAAAVQRTPTKGRRAHGSGGGGGAGSDGIEEELGIVPTLPIDFAPSDLLVPTTWQAMAYFLLPVLPAYRARAAAAAAADKSGAPAVAGQGPAALQELQGLRGGLGRREHELLPVGHKLLLLELLVDAAFDTRRVKNLLEANTSARTALEAERKEELLRCAKQAKEELADRKERAMELVREQILDGGFDSPGSTRAPKGKRGATVTAAAAENGGKNPRRAKGKGRAGSGSGGGGGNKPPEPTPAQIAAAMADLYEQDAVGGPFYPMDPTAADAATNESDEDAEAEAAAAAAAALSEDEGALAAMSRQELQQRRRQRDSLQRKAAARRKARLRREQLREDRARAKAALRMALATGNLAALAAAAAAAQEAELEGEDDDGNRWVLPELRDALVAVRKLQDVGRQAEVAGRFGRRLAEKFVRTEPVGVDRYGRRYWCFGGDDDRVYVEEMSRRTDAP
ncbi:unnamed protein product, partial [Phaeothamnion confervicola]